MPARSPPGTPPEHRMSPIVLATANPHKVDELRAIFAPAGIEVLGLGDLGTPPPPEPAETGTTFEQNAKIKARAYAQATGRACLADDSGLEIDALGGKPGVISSHYCSDGREEGLTRAQRDAANNTRVLRELEGVPAPQRSAGFVCVMALALPDGPGGEPRIVAITRGRFEGHIGLPPSVPRGANGFGYDPLFLVRGDAAGRTSAELSPEEKNRLSHRAAAAKAMAQRIRTLGLA
jgi:XTP/dITP diphosphohydrolase